MLIIVSCVTVLDYIFFGNSCVIQIYLCCQYWNKGGFDAILNPFSRVQFVMMQL